MFDPKRAFKEEIAFILALNSWHIKDLERKLNDSFMTAICSDTKRFILLRWEFLTRANSMGEIIVSLVSGKIFSFVIAFAAS